MGRKKAKSQAHKKATDAAGDRVRNLNPNGCVRHKETAGGHAMRQPSTQRVASTVGREV